MTSLPVPRHEAEQAAQRFADEQVQKWLDSTGLTGDPYFDIGVSFLHPQAGHIWLQRYFKARFVGDIYARAQIVRDAEAGWTDVQVALGELIQEYEERGQELPDHLRVYRRNFTNPHYRMPRAHASQKADHIFQDIMFVTLVSMLQERFPGLSLYGRSGRSIIAIAARAFAKQHHRIGRGGMNYEAGRNIWRRMGHWL